MKDNLHNTKDEIDSVHLRSEEVKEIMNKVPGRIVRWGISVIAIIIFAVFSFAFAFRYPDIINGTFYLQTTNPPAFLLARSTGKLQALLVSEGDTVSPGQILAVIENPADFKAYLNLKYLTGLKPEPLKIRMILDSLNSRNLRFGELQIPLSAYLKSLDAYKSFIEIDLYGVQRKATQIKFEQHMKHSVLLQTQINTEELNYKLAKQSFVRDSLLNIQKVIAPLDFENAQKSLLAQQMALTNAEIALSSTQLTLAEYKQQIAQLYLNEKQLESELTSNIEQFEGNLLSALSEWESRYCLRSSILGKASFSGVWKENQNVVTGQHLMTILPFGQTEITCRIIIPVNRAGKLQPGQEVNLKFSDFPHREYGMLVSTLNSISSVPDSAYVGTAFIADSLVTNYGRLLPFKQNMQGVAEIITEDLSLAQRLFYPLQAIYKNRIDFGKRED
jgi:multidrug efflux pump subunit AcrA (membrane-fusion protein)